MIESGEATKYLTSMLKGFKLEAADAMSVVDKLTKVDMSAAASAGQIAESLRQFATTAQISGVNIDQAIAMATTIMDVSQRDASSVGAALKTMISRYGNVKAGAFNKLNLDSDSGGEGESLNDIEKVLKKIGISMRDTNLQFRDFDDVLEDLSEKWTTLDNVSKSAVATAMAGVRQRESFLVLMENMDKYHDLVKTSAEAEGTATEKYLSYQESLEASQKRLQAAWENLAQNADINNFLTKITNLAANLIKWLPLILRFGAKIITMTNAWKLPKMLSTLGGKLGLPGLGSIFGVFGKVTGRGRSMTGSEYFSDKVNRYNPERTLGKIAGSIGENVKALQDNTAALRGKKGAAGSKSQKGPNMDDNGNIVDAKGHRLGTDKDGNIVWLDKEGNALKTKVSKKNIEEFKKLQQQRKSQALKAGVASAIMGGVMGFMTAPSTHTDKYGNIVENSREAQSASQGISTLAGTASGVASAFGPWGMAIGAIISIVGEMASKVISTFIDARRDDMNERVKEAEKNLGVLQHISGSVDVLKELSQKSVWTADDYKKGQENITAILDALYSVEGSNARYLIEKFLGGGNVYDLLEQYLNGSQGQRDQIANILEAANALATVEAKKAANEKKIEELRERTNNKTVAKLDGWDMSTLIPVYGIFSGKNKHAGAGLTVSVSAEHNRQKQILADYEKAGINIKAKDQTFGENIMRVLTMGLVNNREYQIDTSSMSLGEQEASFQKLLENAIREGNNELAESARKQLSEIQAIRAETEKINKEMNLSIASAAGLTASYNGKDLLSLTPAQLKSLGFDAIVQIVAQSIEANGGLIGNQVFDSEGNITRYAEDIITTWMKQNSSLYGIVTGQSYMLSEVYQMREGKTKNQYLASFASAIGTTIEELRKEIEEGQGKILEKYGKTTLGDWLKSPQDTFTKLNNIGEVLASISQANSLSNDAIQNILNNYPELLQFIGKEDNLYKSILESVEAYSSIYGKQIFDSYLTSAGYFDSISQEIKKMFTEIGGDYEQLIATGFGKASTIQDVITWATTTTNKMGEQVLSILKEIMDNEFSVRTREKEFDLYSSTVVKYYEKQLDNLKEQKDALKDINKQREYELSLMKAKLDLENAQKEKRRVWREGVGWVYEADQSKIADAQQKLRETQNQKTISELELEITELEAIKEYITNFKATEEYSAQMEALDVFINENGLSINATNQLTNAITDLYRYVEKINLGEKLEDLLDTQTKNKEIATQELQKRWTAYQNALSTYNSNKTVANAQTVNDTLADYQNYYSNALENHMISSDGYSNWNPETGQQEYYETDSSKWGSQESLTTAESGKGIDLGYRYVWYDAGQNKTYSFTEGTSMVSSAIKGYILGDMIKGKATAWSASNPNGYTISDAAGYESLDDYARDHDDMIINGWDGDWEIVAIRNHQLYYLYDGRKGKAGGTKGDSTGGRGFYKEAVPYALGTLSAHGGFSLVNEFGTEAIVTPGGTVTALPSATGVVPADITKNLWELGEIAPNIIQMMMGSGLSRLGRNNVLTNSIVNGDSLNINTVNMTVNADDSFNVDKFVSEMKTAVTLNKNNRR